MSRDLRAEAVEIWKAGVEAIDSERLVRESVSLQDGELRVLGEAIPLDEIDRVVVVGGGKAGAGMVAGVEAVFDAAGESDRLTGWVNVPADCVRATARVRLHAARPAGRNEPCAEGVEGTQRILELAGSLGPRDVAVVLISGGGSALLPAPVDGISLADKQAVTRTLASAGATINELNTVRKHLSALKGGGLARVAAGARRVYALAISDVIGDPLDVIASGPTVADTTTAADALAVLDRLAPSVGAIPDSVHAVLRAAAAGAEPRGVPANVVTHVVGSNAVALAAAAKRADELGYEVRSLGSENAGIAAEVGRDLANDCRRIRDDETTPQPVCLLSGGEPTVRLAETDRPRKGGRNQELALAALVELWDDGLDHVVVLSGGTDGEDGPTDAAGGVADAAVLAKARERNLDPTPHLAINDSYTFLDPVGGLLKTGPTHTNVMDLRVALVDR